MARWSSPGSTTSPSSDGSNSATRSAYFAPRTRRRCPTRSSSIWKRGPRAGRSAASSGSTRHTDGASSRPEPSPNADVPPLHFQAIGQAREDQDLPVTHATGPRLRDDDLDGSPDVVLVDDHGDL